MHAPGFVIWELAQDCDKMVRHVHAFFPGRSVYHAAGLLSFILHFQLARTCPSVSRDCVRTSGVPDLLILHVLCSNGACWLTLPGCSTANFPTADEVRMSTDRRGPIAATLCQFSHVKYGSVLCQNQRCLDRYTGLQKLWIYPLFSWRLTSSRVIRMTSRLHVALEKSAPAVSFSQPFGTSRITCFSPEVDSDR